MSSFEKPHFLKHLTNNGSEKPSVIALDNEFAFAELNFNRATT